MARYFEDAIDESADSKMILPFLKHVRDLASRSADFDWELKTLYSIRKWAIEQQAVSSGDRVRLRETIEIDKNASLDYIPFEPTFKKGATGIVKSVDFNAHYGTWSAWVQFDEVYVRLTHPKDEIRRLGKRDYNTFGFRPDVFEVLSPSRSCVTDGGNAV